MPMVTHEWVRCIICKAHCDLWSQISDNLFWQHPLCFNISCNLLVHDDILFQSTRSADYYLTWYIFVEATGKLETRHSVCYLPPVLGTITGIEKYCAAEYVTSLLSSRSCVSSWFSLSSFAIASATLGRLGEEHSTSEKSSSEATASVEEAPIISSNPIERILLVIGMSWIALFPWTSSGWGSTVLWVDAFT